MQYSSWEERHIQNVMAHTRRLCESQEDGGRMRPNISMEERNDPVIQMTLDAPLKGPANITQT